MKATLETPNQLLERLEHMGLDHAKNLLAKKHFEPKTLGLVQGWISRKEEERNPPPAPELDPAVQEALKIARQAIREARRVREAAAKTQRMAIIAIAVAGAGIAISILSLFATALR